jgi:hypothetical protein
MDEDFDMDSFEDFEDHLDYGDYADLDDDFAFASAGHGTDEDYGYFGGDEY